MKFFMLSFRVVVHISMLPVRGAHTSVFPRPLFLFCVFSFDCNVPPWGYSNGPLNLYSWGPVRRIFRSETGSI